MGLVTEKLKYKDILLDINCRLNRNKIIGLFGDSSNTLIDIFNGDIDDFDGAVILNKMHYDHEFFKKNPSSISLIEVNPFFYSTVVEEEFKFTYDFRKINDDKVEKRMNKYLNLVSLDESYLKRSISTLSSSEKYLIGLAINLSLDSEVYLFKDVFEGLDHNLKKKVSVIIKNLKEDNKIVILSSASTDILYEICDEIVLFKDKTIFKTGTVDKIFTSVDLLKGSEIPMPNISKVTYFAKTNKKAKLSYHKDVRDIIKDIYKHV